MKTARVLVAEFIGTFALVFFGAGAIIGDAALRGLAAFGPVDLVLVAAAHAIVLGVMVTALGHISGAHFNPAVTVGALIGRHITPALAGMYAITQLVAGIVAAALLKYVFNSAAVSVAQLGAPSPSQAVGTVRAYVIEVVLTFFLMTVVYATAIDPRGAFAKVAGFAIGLTLFFDIVVGGPLTGAAMNPARAFGPALLGGLLSGDQLGPHFIVYWIGPVVGAALAALLYQGLLIRDPGAEDVPPPSEE